MDEVNENDEQSTPLEEDVTAYEEGPAAKEEEMAFSSAHQPKQIYMTDVELKRLQKEAAEYKDKYLRLLAEGDNMRKRLQKERMEMTQFAVENAIVDFLPPLDNLENALKFAQNMSEEVKHWALGFQMILTQFKDALANNGVAPIDSLGKTFDPYLHEAMEMKETNDSPPGTVVEECIRGYKMGEKTIRPARVKVAKAFEPEEPAETEIKE